MNITSWCFIDTWHDITFYTSKAYWHPRSHEVTVDVGNVSIWGNCWWISTYGRQCRRCILHCHCFTKHLQRVKYLHRWRSSRQPWINQWPTYKPRHRGSHPGGAPPRTGSTMRWLLHLSIYYYLFDLFDLK